MEKVNVWLAASQHMGPSGAEGSPWDLRRNGFILTALHGASVLVHFLENDVVGFDENLAVVLCCALQRYVMLQ